MTPIDERCKEKGCLLQKEKEELIQELEKAKAIAAAKERVLMLNIKEMDSLYEILRTQINQLKSAQRKNQDIFMETMETLAKTLEAKDSYTRGHSDRVAEYAMTLAKSLDMDEDKQEELRLAASLHDLGKMGIKEDVLNKKGKLTAEQYEYIKEHPRKAVEILKYLEPAQHLLPIIRHHHERFDGKGYPDGLKGEEIPFGARVIALADTFDAMTSNRPYRKAMPISAALVKIEEQSGSQFDPALVESWLKLFEEV